MLFLRERERERERDGDNNMYYKYYQKKHGCHTNQSIMKLYLSNFNSKTS